MCGRYWTDESPELREIVEEMNRSPLVDRWHRTTKITAYGEIRPTDVVPVIAPNRAGARAVFPMKWGYTGRSLLINARVETAASRPTFREDWKRHRCIIPASWYFEWEHILDNNGKKHTGDKWLESEKLWIEGKISSRENSTMLALAASMTKSLLQKEDFTIDGYRKF